MVKKEEITTEKAKKALEEEKKKRVNICTDAIEKILKENDCAIEPYMIITRSGNVPRVEIVANNT